MRHAEQVADDLDRNGGGEILDQVGAPLRGHRVEQSIDQRDEAGFHLGDDAVRQRHLDRAAHMGVQRRIVEHEAGGVMLEQRRIAVFRAELDLLVGGEHARIAVDRVAIAPARDQVGAVRHAMHRIVLAQRAVIRERIVDEVGRQALEVEIARSLSRGTSLAASATTFMALLRRQSTGSRRCRQGTSVANPVEFGHSRAGKTPMDKDGSIAPDASQRNAADEAPLKLEEFLPYRLNVAAALASQALSRIYAERYGIGVPEWRVLATLGQYGVMTGKAVGAHSHMHKTKVSRAVAQLEKRKLLARRANKADMREAFLSLTPAGRAIYQDLAPVAAAFADRFIEAIDPADRERVRPRAEGARRAREETDDVAGACPDQS